jgi:carbon monoxide dehydrogenase subunit G
VQLENSFTVPVPVDEAWRVLLDIERIAPCMPGAALDSVDGDDFTGRVKVKLGPINLTYQGKASFTEKDEAAHRAVIDARGKDQRGNGTATATITANLAAEGAITRVNVLTDLNITGRPAQFGRGVMTDVGNKLLGQFADKLAAQLGAGDAQGDADRAESAAQKAAATATGAVEEIAASAEQAAGDGTAVKKAAAATKKAAAAATDKVSATSTVESATSTAGTATSTAGTATSTAGTATSTAGTATSTAGSATSAPAKKAPPATPAKKAPPAKAGKAAPGKTGAAEAAPVESAPVTATAGPADSAPAAADIAPAATDIAPATKAPSGPPSGTTAPPRKAASGAPVRTVPSTGPATVTAPAASPPPPVAEAEPIDLLEIAGGAAMARYAAPVAGVVATVLVVAFLVRRRRHRR